MKEKTMTKKDKFLLYSMAIGVSILLILRDISGVSVSKYLYMGFAILLMALASYETLVRMLCFLLPLVCGLPGTYIMLAALVLLVFKRGSIKLIQLIPIACILLLELFASFWYPSADLVAVVNYVSFAGTMIFLIQDDKQMDYRDCVKWYLWGSLVLCGVIFYATMMIAPKNWMEQFADGNFRFGQEHAEELGMKLTLNANSLAYYSLVGAACSILLMEKTVGAKKLWYIAAMLFFAVTGFLTTSRSWIILGMICLVLYIASKLRSPKQFVTLFVVLLVVVAVATWYLNANPELLAGFETRFEDDTVESGGSRIGIFQKYMKIFLANTRFLLVGTGVTQTNQAAGTAGSMHNGLQQILVTCGVVGFVLYMIVLIGPILRSHRGKKMPLIYWLPLISVVAFTQTIQFLNPTMLMLPYIIGIYALRAGGQSNENISDNRGHGGGRPVGLETR